MSLNLLHLPIRTQALFAAGRAHGLVRDDWSVEPGYLVHALFARMFGDAAPKPFDVQTSQGEAGERLAVLAYAAATHEALQARAAADPAVADAIAWPCAGTKAMPPLGAGQRLGFRVRICPVVRVGRRHARFREGAEVDPYLALIQQQLAQAGPFATEPEERACKAHIVAEAPSREAVYGDWLAARLGDAASVTAARIVAQRDARLWRKGAPGEGAARQMHGHARAREARRSVIGRRDVTFEGELQVADAAAFAALLARGVGRHRAFGFGMLLLRPSRDR